MKHPHLSHPPSPTHQPPALIIALVGKPGAGKDSVADALALAPPQGFARIAFADTLRREVAEAWRIDLRMLTARHTKEWPLPALAVDRCSDPAFARWVADGGDSLTAPRSPRWTLQHWGSFKRRFVPDYCARIVERWIASQLRAGQTRFVVTDLRYPDEAAMLRRLGAVVVRVHRPDMAELPTLAADTAQHTSELHHQHLHADAHILNDCSLQALAEAALECVEHLCQRQARSEKAAA